MLKIKTVALLLAFVAATTAFVSPLQKSNAPSPLFMSFSNQVQRRRPTKSLLDRTPQEAVSLIQDVLRATIEAGPRAGPARTLQAYRAVTKTTREFLPQLLSQQVSTPVILRTFFERMGATYVKLGQFIASSPTLFPKEYVLEFQKCLDQTEPLPWNTIKAVVEAELGPISTIFDYVDTTPLASASIAQVHSARLKNGDDVVIKVQKPGIDDCLKADLGFLYSAARILEFSLPDWERTSLAAVAGDIRASMLEELDFELEARNTIEFRRFLEDNQLTNQVTAPRVYQDYTSKRVLVLERLNGVSLLDEKTVATVSRDPQQGVDAIISALNVWSMSVTAMPWFHADVHAGNLLLLNDGRIGFIDFGIVGKISDKVFASVTELSMAMAVSDSQGMAKALCNMGATDEKVDIVKFGQDIDRLLKKMNYVQADVSVMTSADEVLQGEITDLLLELVEITENNGLKLPREFGLLVKQSLYFDRYLKVLAPKVDVVNDARIMLGGRPRDESSVEPLVIDVL
jgi:aarF domain-containing kinase